MSRRPEPASSDTRRPSVAASVAASATPSANAEDEPVEEGEQEPEGPKLRLSLRRLEEFSSLSGDAVARSA